MVACFRKIVSCLQNPTINHLCVSRQQYVLLHHWLLFSDTFLSFCLPCSAPFTFILAATSRAVCNPLLTGSHQCNRSLPPWQSQKWDCASGKETILNNHCPLVLFLRQRLHMSYNDTRSLSGFSVENCSKCFLEWSFLLSLRVFSGYMTWSEKTVLLEMWIFEVKGSETCSLLKPIR